MKSKIKVIKCEPLDDYKSIWMGMSDIVEADIANTELHNIDIKLKGLEEEKIIKLENTSILILKNNVCIYGWTKYKDDIVKCELRIIE